MWATGESFLVNRIYSIKVHLSMPEQPWTNAMHLKSHLKSVNLVVLLRAVSDSLNPLSPLVTSTVRAWKSNMISSNRQCWSLQVYKMESVTNGWMIWTYMLENHWRGGGHRCFSLSWKDWHKKARGGNTIKHNRFANSSFQGRINGMGEICDWLAWSSTAFEIIMLLLLLVGERVDTP